MEGSVQAPTVRLAHTHVGTADRAHRKAVMEGEIVVPLMLSELTHVEAPFIQ